MARSSHRPSINRSMDSVLDSSGIEKKSYEAGVATRTTAAEDIIAAEEEFTPEEYKRLRRKIDLIIMPILMLIYGIQFSDKTSLSAGAIFGLPEDTNLKDGEFGNLAAFFYMAYAVAQYPMQWVLQRVPLGRGLAACTILWGAMVMLQGACNNYAGLAVVRVFLGWFESVVTPGFAIYTSAWYLRREQTQRQTLYYSMNCCLAMVLGVGIYFLALNAQNNGGLAAWRVICLFLGGITVGLGIIFAIVGGTPDEVWWLSAREKRMAKARIVSNATGGGESHSWKWAQVRECLRDPQYWIAVGLNFFTNVPNGATTTFNNIIWVAFGFSDLESILYSLPAYGITFVCVIVSGLVVFKWPRTRFPLAIFFQCLTTFALLFVGIAWNADKWDKWGVYNMSLLCTIATFILIWPMMSYNVAGRTKKSFFGASNLISYCVGNIVGTQIMRANDAPRYTAGLSVGAACMMVAIILVLTWRWYYARENKRRDKAFAESGLSVEEQQLQNRMAGESDQTDMENPHFRYMI